MLEVSSLKVFSKVGVPQDSNMSPFLFLICVNDMPNPSHHQTNKFQFGDDKSKWVMSKSIDLAAKYMLKDIGQ